MAHRRMNSRPVNPAYQFSNYSPPPSPYPPIRELPPMSASPVLPWIVSRPPSPQSSSSSKNSLDSFPLPLSSNSSFESSKEDYYFRDEDEDMFIGTSNRKTTRSQSWLRRITNSSGALLVRRPRPRTTFIVLLCLSVLSVYIIFTSSSLSTQSHPISIPHDAPAQQFGDHEPPLATFKPNLQLASKVNKKLFKGSRPPLVLSPEEELAALTSFLIALPQNVLPSDVEGSKPIDPQAILDFDVRGGRKARAELQVVRTQVWENNPVVVYAKRYAPHTKLLLGGLLNPLNIHPPPAVFFVDERHDGDILMDALKRVSSAITPQPLVSSLSQPSSDTASTLPLLLIGGQLMHIPYEDMTQHKDENDNAAHKIIIKTALKDAIRRVGADTREGSKKKKGH